MKTAQFNDSNAKTITKKQFEDAVKSAEITQDHNHELSGTDINEHGDTIDYIAGYVWNNMDVCGISMDFISIYSQSNVDDMRIDKDPDGGFELESNGVLIVDEDGDELNEAEILGILMSLRDDLYCYELDFSANFNQEREA